jgi:hypothetical protein
MKTIDSLEVLKNIWEQQFFVIHRLGLAVIYKQHW